MKNLKLSFLLMAGFSMTACAGSDYYNKSSYPAQKQQTSIGEVWASPEGKTLYTFTKDTAGASNCYDACAVKWPPLYAKAPSKGYGYGRSKPSSVGEFSVITRKDGTYQWAYKNMPLYTWFQDQAAGDITGHGVINVWFATRADDAPVKVFVNDSQAILTDARQMSLYTFDKDGAGQSNCYGGCAEKWPPVLADKSASVTAPYSLVTRNDGQRQLALNGKPLYTWIMDTKPGDTTGDGVKGVWHVVQLSQ